MRRAALVLALTLSAAAPSVAETIDVRPELTFQGSVPLQQSVEAHVGDTIRVDLPAQAGTGYSWTATVAGDILQPGRTVGRPASRPGGPERSIMSYLATAAGTARVTFAYQRPWESAKGPARQVVLSVAVTEPPMVDPLAPPQQP
ncbi:MAG: protease inhibitor I42 family protein [Amaricoccus sp.]